MAFRIRSSPRAALAAGVASRVVPRSRRTACSSASPPAAPAAPTTRWAACSRSSSRTRSTIGGKKLSATAETAGASVANAQLLGRKDIESAFVAADILDAAYKGTGQFDGKPLKNLRALGALYPEQVQLVTLRVGQHQERSAT